MLWVSVLATALPFTSVLPQRTFSPHQHAFTELTATESCDCTEITNTMAPPREVPFDTENYPIAPPELVLEQVHVYVRHGKAFVG